MSEWISGSVPVVKVVLLGESSVGKTSLVMAVHEQNYPSEHTPTVGACFVIRNFQIDGVDIKLHIWDTAGQERFRTLTPMYYRDSQYVLLVYAVDSEESLNRLDSWRRDIGNECEPLPHLVLIGNKTDLAETREIAKSTGEESARRLGARFYEVSAKEDRAAVVQIFADIAAHALTVTRQQPVSFIEGAHLNGMREQKKCKC
jgi:small GTP-binding protein